MAGFQGYVPDFSQLKLFDPLETEKMRRAKGEADLVLEQLGQLRKLGDPRYREAMSSAEKEAYLAGSAKSDMELKQGSQLDNLRRLKAEADFSEQQKLSEEQRTKSALAAAAANELQYELEKKTFGDKIALANAQARNMQMAAAQNAAQADLAQQQAADFARGAPFRQGAREQNLQQEIFKTGQEWNQYGATDLNRQAEQQKVEAGARKALRDISEMPFQIEAAGRKSDLGAKKVETEEERRRRQENLANVAQEQVVTQQQKTASEMLRGANLAKTGTLIEQKTRGQELANTLAAEIMPDKLSQQKLKNAMLSGKIANQTMINEQFQKLSPIEVAQAQAKLHRYMAEATTAEDYMKVAQLLNAARLAKLQKDSGVVMSVADGSKVIDMASTVARTSVNPADYQRRMTALAANQPEGSKAALLAQADVTPEEFAALQNTSTSKSGQTLHSVKTYQTPDGKPVIVGMTTDGRLMEAGAGVISRETFQKYTPVSGQSAAQVGDVSRARKEGSDVAAHEAKILDAGNEATQNLGKLQAAKDQMKGIVWGAPGAVISAATPILQTIGINATADSKAAREAFEGLITGLTIGQAKELRPASDTDMKLLRQSLGSPTMQRESVEALIRVAQKLEVSKLNRAADLNKLAAQGITFKNRMELENALGDMAEKRVKAEADREKLKSKLGIK